MKRRYLTQCAEITQSIETGSYGKSPEPPIHARNAHPPHPRVPIGTTTLQPIQERDASPPTRPAAAHKLRWIHTHMRPSLFLYPRVAATTRAPIQLPIPGEGPFLSRGLGRLPCCRGFKAPASDPGFLFMGSLVYRGRIGAWVLWGLWRGPWTAVVGPSGPRALAMLVVMLSGSRDSWLDVEENSKVSLYLVETNFLV